MITKIDEFIKRAYNTACSHGFHDEKTSVEHQMMLVISEVGEAVEADRKNLHANPAGFEKCIGVEYGQRFKDYVKDSVEDEIADVCIRLFDMCGYFGIKPWRAGEEVLTLRNDWENEFGKMTFTEQAYALVQLLAPCCSPMTNEPSKEALNHIFGSVLFFIYYWSKNLGFDLAWHIEQKMKYNESRGYKHGKKY